MDSKYPPAESNSAYSSRSSLLPHDDEGRDSADPTMNTTNDKNQQSGASGINANSIECSTTNAAKHNMVVVSGSPNDIICGRGLHIMSHHGNRNLHLIVDRYRQAYQTSTRKEKAAITQRIVQELKRTGARFLRRFNDAGDGKWVEVDDKTAYKKVGHALRLRKSDQGQHFLKSLYGQPGDGQRSLMLNSMSGTETNTTQNAVGMSSGTQNTMSHLSRISPSSSSLAMQLPTPSPQHPLQIAIQSQVASQAGVGMQPETILPPSATGGYGNVVIDPRLYSQVFTSTLALMTQMQHQQRPLFHGSSASFWNSNQNSDEERRGNF